MKFDSKKELTACLALEEVQVTEQTFLPRKEAKAFKERRPAKG